MIQIKIDVLIMHLIYGDDCRVNLINKFFVNKNVWWFLVLWEPQRGESRRTPIDRASVTHDGSALVVFPPTSHRPPAPHGVWLFSVTAIAKFNVKAWPRIPRRRVLHCRPARSRPCPGPTHRQIATGACLQPAATTAPEFPLLTSVKNYTVCCWQ